MGDTLPVKKRFWLRLIRLFLWIFVAWLAFLFAVILVINIPAVQTFVTGIVSKSLRDKIGTEISVGKVRIAFPKTVNISEVFCADQQADTLLYLKEISIKTDLFALLRNKIKVKNLVLRNVVGHVTRKASTDFNFQFILDAFSSPDTLPETEKSGKPWTFEVTDVDLRNIAITFYDEVEGINAGLDLGELFIRVKNFDPNKMDYRAEKIDISNATAFLEQWNVAKTFKPEGQDGPVQGLDLADSTLLPEIGIGLLCMDSVKARYINKDARQDFRLDLGLLEFSPKTIDLNHQKLELGELFLSNSSFLVSLALAGKTNETTACIPDNPTSPAISDEEKLKTSIFPDWEISMDKLEFEKIDLKYDDVLAPKIPAGIDYSHLKVDELILKTGAISVSPEGLIADIQNISFTEQSGFDLKKLIAKAEFSDKTAGLKDLEIETAKSIISGTLQIGFASLDDLQNNPGQTDVSLDLKKLELNTSDVFIFAPDLASDSLLGNYKNETVIANAAIEGKINNLTIENLDLWILDFTKLKTSGQITGLPEPVQLGFDMTIHSLSGHLSDLSPFIDSLIPPGISLPEAFLIKGSVKGKIDDLTAEILLNTPFGDVSAEASYLKNYQPDRDSFNVDFEINDLMVNQVLSDTIYRNLRATGNISGTGAGSDSIAAIAGLLIQEAGYNNYLYKNIETKAIMNGAKYSAEIKSTDPNIQFDLTANADLRQEKQVFSTQIEIGSLNLSALNFMEDEILVWTTISASANYTSPENMDVNIRATDTKLTRERFVAPVNSLEFVASVLDNHLEAGLKSDLLDARLTGNVEPQKLEEIMRAMMNQYLGIDGSADVTPGNSMAFSVEVHLPEHIKKLIGEDFDMSEIRNMHGSYNSDNNELTAEMQVDRMTFGLVNLDTLKMIINGKNDSLSLAFDFRKISLDTMKIENFGIHESIKNGNIFSEIKISDTSKMPRYLFLNKIKVADSSLNISFLPDGLILDSEKWTVEKDNFLKINANEITSQNFVFTNKDEALEFTSEHDNPVLKLTNFSLENMLNIVEFTRHGHMIKGRVDGEIAFPGEGNTQPLFAGLKIDSLYLVNNFAGSFSLAANTDSSNLVVKVLLKNEQNQINLTGNIFNWQLAPEFDLNLLIDLQNLKAAERFLLGTVTEMGGKVFGEVTVKGAVDNPEIIGAIEFNEAVMKITSLNFLTHLRNEKLTFNANGLRFDNFVVEDAQQQKLTINGNILTENYSDYNFDLHIVTNNFQPINSTSADNKTFYGKMFINTDITLKGNAASPVVDANIKINKGTDLTYALPGSELQLITPEGIVHFVDHIEKSDTTIVADDGNFITDSIMSGISGFDLTTNLEIDPDARFTVIIDPRSGDYLTIGGSAILSISADPGGNQTMTGIYEVKTGVYQLSFYGLVKKSFSIKPGSNISWSGKPMDASLNITAEYEVTTSSVALIANETSSMSDSEKNIYKQRLPYTVLLNIDGFLAQPEISFNITLPDKYMINYPQVASKLGQLNTPEMESERNKQVFGLLVTGSFIADNPLASTGSSTSSIATTAAINSVNGILTDQLNNVSSKYVKNVDLDFGLNSYEDYSGTSSEMRTELDVKVSKKLFNDRLTVEAQGSFDVDGNKNSYSTESSQEMWGEFAVTYSLNPEGNYKLRAYRENAYDLFDGEVAYSGIAFIFEKEFNNLKRKNKKEPKDSQPDGLPNNEGLKSNPPKTENK